MKADANMHNYYKTTSDGWLKKCLNHINWSNLHYFHTVLNLFDVYISLKPQASPRLPFSNFRKSLFSNSLPNIRFKTSFSKFKLNYFWNKRWPSDVILGRRKLKAFFWVHRKKLSSISDNRTFTLRRSQSLFLTLGFN